MYFEKITPEIIYKKDLCLGCGICNSISRFADVNFTEDKNGKLKPDSKNTNIDNLSKICPGLFIENEHNLDDINKVVWGYYNNIYEGYSNDDEIRFRGSSGGTITGISLFLLENKLVDGIMHLGESENPLKFNMTLSKTKEELVKSTGSKYIASNYLNNFREVLDSNEGSFAFVGKPCDISAVKQFIKNDISLKGRISLYISFFCAGLPTLKAIDKITDNFGISRNDIEKISFRGNGWPGKFRIETKSKKEYTLTYDDSWGKYLGKDIHFRCKICPDGVGKLADVACGDAWTTEGDFSEKPGKSVIITRTKLGDEIISNARNRDYLDVNTYDITKLKTIQKYQYSRHFLLFSRLLAFKVFNRRYPVFKNLGYKKLVLKTGMIKQIKSFVGTLKRILK